MKILKLQKETFWEVTREALKVLRAGGLIVYPTDTLYALGANALDEHSIVRLFNLKQRSRNKPVPLMVRNLKWAEAVAHIYQRERKILQAVWPGRVTIVLPKRPEIPAIVTANRHTVALRVPDHPFVEFLLSKFGYPITGTSANISGEKPFQRIHDVIERFRQEPHRPDLIIDTDDLVQTQPSTVLDLSGPEPKILRVGMTNPETLMKLLQFS